MTPAMHDAGGKGRLPLLPGVVGYAEFRGERQEHRLTLGRTATPFEELVDVGLFALWCGMNPSTAAADEDDLTVRKEQEWTRRMGLRRYVKVNLGSYRSTDPRGLSVRGVEVSHPDNLPTILRLAAQAHTFVLACGDPPDPLLPYAREALRAFKRAGVRMMCLGTTKAGWPKHSSRLGYDTPMVEFRP